MIKTDLIGYLAGIFIIVSLLPQIIKSWRTKSTRDISLLRYLVYIFGLILWVVWGILVSSWPVIMMNGVAVVFALLVIFLKVRYDETAK